MNIEIEENDRMKGSKKLCKKKNNNNKSPKNKQRIQGRK